MHVDLRTVGNPLITTESHCKLELTSKFSLLLNQGARGTKLDLAPGETNRNIVLVGNLVGFRGLGR